MNIPVKGHLVVVVGASGAGKDSLLNAAKARFETEPRIEFVQRIITRECDPATEIHDSLTEEQFLEQQQGNAFSVWWQANGLYYGLPVSMHEALAQGQLLIANGSRAALPAIRATFSSLTVVHVTASAEALAERLVRRSRESPAEIEQRLLRNQSIQPIVGEDVLTIDNSGARETAINQFLFMLEKQLV